MFTYILRFLLIINICFALIQANPSSTLKRVKWIPARMARPFANQNEPNFDQYRSSDEIQQDPNDNHGFATWLFRSRRFCCAPPL